MEYTKMDCSLTPLRRSTGATSMLTHTCSSGFLNAALCRYARYWNTQTVRKKNAKYAKDAQSQAAHLTTNAIHVVCFFTNACSLAVHRVKKHGEQNIARSQVHDNTCPGCNKTFSNRINAQRHWQAQICAHNRTATRTIDQVAESIRNAQANASESITGNIARSILSYLNASSV